jgi:hypothetical protein
MAPTVVKGKTPTVTLKAGRQQASTFLCLKCLTYWPKLIAIGATFTSRSGSRPEDRPRRDFTTWIQLPDFILTHR